ncbi:MAG: 2,3-diphosphoglycerate-dependent phosphoglycerate mutase [Arenicellales bacterium]
MKRLVLVRHGQSMWNLENRFTGWTDVDLTDRGIEEATDSARLLKEAGFVFDQVYTSLLKRSIRTTWIILDNMDLMWVPLQKTWVLNERHYGALQGMDKKEVIQNYGEEQVQKWRRGFEIRPPELSKSDPRHPMYDVRYSDLGSKLPNTESLHDTLDRVLEFWESTIRPQIEAGKQVMICAHGNSLRALMKYIENISDDDIAKVNMPTGIPLVYELDETMHAQKRYYLGDKRKVEAGLNEVAAQTKVPKKEKVAQIKEK